MSLRMGLPYKGSKNTIALSILECLPSKANFYDLFAGGCAVTHAALLSGKYRNYFANDITDYPQVFLKAIVGGFRNESRWISREDFQKLKDKEAYIKYCWSFGNCGRQYLYSKEVEPWKKALHYAQVLGNFSLLREFGINTDDASRKNIKRHEKEYKDKYILWYCKEVLYSSLDALELRKNLEERVKRNSEELRNYLINGLKSSNKRPCDVDRFLGTNGMAGHYFGKSQWEFPTREVYEKLQGFINLPLAYDEVYGLQELLESLQRLQSLERLESLESLQSLTVTQKDYRDVRIKPNSIIYCDIPYKGTDGYGEDKRESFDHDSFYKWCAEQKELVVVSEYSMPDDFICINEIEKRVTLSSGSSKTAIERLFIPKHQKELWDKIGVKKWVQLELFSDCELMCS